VRLRDQRGFTLIELLVVIVILGLLAGIVGPRLIANLGKSKRETAKSQIVILEGALDRYQLDVGRYPEASPGLAALQQSSATGWNGPYLKKSIPNDPWGNAYKYRCCPGQHGEYDLWSEGGDGAPGGEGENADITSWDASTAQR